MNVGRVGAVTNEPAEPSAGGIADVPGTTTGRVRHRPDTTLMAGPFNPIVLVRASAHLKPNASLNATPVREVQARGFTGPILENPRYDLTAAGARSSVSLSGTIPLATESASIDISGYPLIPPVVVEVDTVTTVPRA